MHPRSLTLLRAAVLLCVIGLVAACSNPGASTGPTTGRRTPPTHARDRCAAARAAGQRDAAAIR